MAVFESRPQRILLPVNPLFVAITFALALLFNLLPWRDVNGLPDMVALMIAFWCVREPRKMGIAFAWILGLAMDAGNGALLGQHALAYSVLAFAAIGLSRRIQWFPQWQQALHVLLLLLATQLIMLGVRLAAGAPFPGITWLLGSVVAAALWPLATMVLLAPQRRPESVDENRPI